MADEKQIKASIKEGGKKGMFCSWMLSTALISCLAVITATHLDLQEWTFKVCAIWAV